MSEQNWHQVRTMKKEDRAILLGERFAGYRTTYREVGERLRVHASTAKSWIKRGILPKDREKERELYELFQIDTTNFPILGEESNH